MMAAYVKHLPGRSFWLSLLFHLIVVCLLLMTWNYSSPPSIKPDSYIPSYVYHDEAKPTQQAPQPPEQTLKQSNLSSVQGVEKPNTTMTQQAIIPTVKQLRATPLSKKREAIQDDVNLIGDKKMDAPLLKLLGKSLSAHLAYPKPAVDFNVRGLVTIGFMLYPDGHITNIQLVGTSHAGVLDEASLLAVSAMSPVLKVAEFLDKPKYLVVGIIFG